MKKFFIIFFSTFLLVFASAQSGQEVIEKAGGFSYVLPEGWSLREVTGFNYKFGLAKTSDNFTPNINFLDENFAGSLEDYVDISKNQLAKIFEYDIISQTDMPTQFMGDVTRLEIFIEVGKISAHEIVYLVDAKTKKFVVACTRLPNQSEEIDVQCDKIVDSFKLL